MDLDRQLAVIILFTIGHSYIAPGCTIVLLLERVQQPMNFAPTKCIQDVWHFLVRVFWFFEENYKGFTAVDTWNLVRETMSNDVHIIAVSGSTQLFVTRSVRRFPKPWNMDGIASVEACPWSFGYASLGSQLVLAKRISAPPILSLPEVKPRDLDAEAVINVPPTPVEQEDGPQPTRPVAAVAPPVSSILASDVFAGELETQMEVSAEAGIPLSVGLEVPSTPMTLASLPMTMPSSSEPSSASGHAGTTVPASGVHGREGASDVDEANRPTKQARIMAIFEHEDDTHPLDFQDGDVDTLELHEYEMEDEYWEGAATDVASDNILKRLSVPHSTFEPEVDPATLLQLDLLADELEISRLKGDRCADPS